MTRRLGPASGNVEAVMAGQADPALDHTAGVGQELGLADGRQTRRNVGRAAEGPGAAGSLEGDQQSGRPLEGYAAAAAGQEDGIALGLHAVLGHAGAELEHKAARPVRRALACE